MNRYKRGFVKINNRGYFIYNIIYSTWCSYL